jgi:hypothetical protein
MSVLARVFLPRLPLLRRLERSRWHRAHASNLSFAGLGQSDICGQMRQEGQSEDRNPMSPLAVAVEFREAGDWADVGETCPR